MCVAGDHIVAVHATKLSALTSTQVTLYLANTFLHGIHPLIIVFFVWLWDIGIAATTGNIGYIWVSIDWVALYSLVRSSVRMVTSPFRDALLERRKKNGKKGDIVH